MDHSDAGSAGIFSRWTNLTCARDVQMALEECFEYDVDYICDSMGWPPRQSHEANNANVRSNEMPSEALTAAPEVASGPPYAAAVPPEGASLHLVSSFPGTPPPGPLWVSRSSSCDMRTYCCGMRRSWERYTRTPLRLEGYETRVSRNARIPLTVTGSWYTSTKNCAYHNTYTYVKPL